MRVSGEGHNFTLRQNPSSANFAYRIDDCWSDIYLDATFIPKRITGFFTTDSRLRTAYTVIGCFSPLGLPAKRAIDVLFCNFSVFLTVDFIDK